MIGKTISHYKILEKIGAGGMGVVYKAEDTKLKRIVALKFLPPEFSRDKEAKKRFLNEAQAASALDHPNICNIFEIDEIEDAQMFISMAYYKGKTLKDKITTGPLPLEKAINIAIQVAEGLNKAHKKNIIHRDIKAANIMMTDDNVVKIVDFGLAKLKGQTKLTKEGTTLGTIDYMSPEQASGGKVDHRTDIWSLGVLLYEMVTGQLPFTGEYNQAVMYAIMNEEPEPVTGLRTGVPLELERIVNKTLAKDPEERYQTTADLLVDLRNIRKESKPEVKLAKKELRQKITKKSSRKFVITGTLILSIIVIFTAFLLFKGTPPKEPSETEGIKQGRKIAVLPFVDMSPDKNQEYFCDGISEELLNRLAKISAFRVTARTSSFSFKGQNIDIPTIGKRLNVDLVIEGSVRKAGDKIRITAQLIKVSDGYHLWSETYDRLMKDLFAIQDEISLSIVEKLKVSLLKEEFAEFKKQPTNNIKAYNLYLQGIRYFNQGYSGKNLMMAIQMFEKAIISDPDFALAYSKLSTAYIYLYWHYYDRTDICLAKARDAVNNAFKISPDLPEAHIALGFYYYYSHLEYDRGLEHFKKAQKSLKNNAELFMGIASIQRRQGKFNQAVDNLRKAIELDPLNNTYSHEVAITYLFIRNYQEAEYYFNRAISLSPDWPTHYGREILLNLLWKGNVKKALKILKEVPKEVQSSQLPRFVLPSLKLYMINGSYQKALNLLTLLSSDTINYHYQFIPIALLFAEVYGFLNQLELEQKYYNSARRNLEKKVIEYKEDARIHSSLGIAYAGLGRREEAIQEGKLAVNLLPVIKDALRGPTYLLNLARIYVMVGEYNLAIDQLEFILSIPSKISIPLLKIDPTWDPLRNIPRFQNLLKGK